MYIEKYWGNDIGGTDDSLTLVDYLADKQKEELSLGEIFSDTGLDKLNGAFQEHDAPLTVMNSEGLEMEFYFAIDLITDLAALLLECKVNGTIRLCDLDWGDSDCSETGVSHIRITATPEEHALMNKALMEFVAAPLTYDLSEMVPEEEMMEMAAACEEIRKELYET